MEPDASLKRITAKWEAKARGPIGIELPDGWFGGKPFDAILDLHKIEQEGEIITIRFQTPPSKEVVLRLSSVGSVSIDKDSASRRWDLVFEHIERVVLVYPHYALGKDELRERAYANATVRVASTV